jgi:phosphoribosylamine--glycine ligase
VAASKGYPEEYKKGYTISGLDSINNGEIFVYLAGTARKNNHIVTNGGRVLGVTAVSMPGDLKATQIKAYEALRKIHFTDIYYRTDIGAKAFGK